MAVPTGAATTAMPTDTATGTTVGPVVAGAAVPPDLPGNQVASRRAAEGPDPGGRSKRRYQCCSPSSSCSRSWSAACSPTRCTSSPTRCPTSRACRAGRRRRVWANHGRCAEGDPQGQHEARSGAGTGRAGRQLSREEDGRAHHLVGPDAGRRADHRARRGLSPGDASSCRTRSHAGHRHRAERRERPEGKRDHRRSGHAAPAAQGPSPVNLIVSSGPAAARSPRSRRA